jgi:hypothetical protein
MGWLGIPIIDRLLGIGEKAADRLIPDENKERDQAHDRANKQADTTQEGERNQFWTPRKILMAVLILPVALQYGVKPSVEWIAAVFGETLVLPDISIEPALRLLMFLLGGLG